MTGKITKLEIQGIVKGAKVTLQRDIAEGDAIETNAKELLGELEKMGVTPIEQAASLMQASLPEGLIPSPVMSAQISEMLVLANPPQSYTVGKAVTEILDPSQSQWALQPKSVKEIQERLTALGVRGVSNLQNFDSVVRQLHKAGKLRREHIEGTYKYYLVGGR